MDAHDRKGILRRLIDVDLHERENDRSERAALRLSLREPIEESGFAGGSRIADDSSLLLAHAGRTWGP